jgi:solute:Na+ symporter, SSS family
MPRRRPARPRREPLKPPVIVRLPIALAPTTAMPEAIAQLAPIDYFIMLAYTLGMLAIGLYFARYVHSAGDLLLAGKSLPFWAIGVSIVASDIGAIDVVFGAGGMYRFGIAQANFDWIGSVPAVLLAAFIFVPYYWRTGVFTIPEFLGRRYNTTVQTIQAVIWLVFMATNVAIMFAASCTILKTLLGWDPWLSVTMTALIVGMYTITGGLAAIVMTDVVQMVVMLIGTAALFALGLWEAGGWEGISQKILAQQDTTNFFQLLLPHSAQTPYPWTGIVFGLGMVMSTAYFVGNQAILQRALGARSEWDAKAGMLVAGFLKFTIPFFIFMPGLTARALYPNLENPDQAVPAMVAALMPAGLLGLMFAAFLAALMSSIDSYLNSCVTVFLSDIYPRLFGRRGRSGLSDQGGLLLGRVLTGLLLVGGAIAAPPLVEKREAMYVVIQTMMSLFQGPTLAILLLGILWRRGTGVGATFGLVLGVCMTSLLTILGDAIFPSENPFLFVTFWTFLFSVLVTVVVSLFTRPEPAEKIRGLVMGDVLHDEAAQAVLSARARQP